MAIAFVAAANSGNVTGASTFDLTITVGAGQALLVAIIADKSSLTSVVWDPAGVNQALTQKDASILNGSYYTYVYGILNPTAGVSKTLRVTLPSSGNGGSAAATYSGTGIAYGNNNHDDQITDTPVSFAPTTANANAWVILAGANPSNNIGAGSGSNLRGSAVYFASLGLFDSGNKVSAGAQSMALTHTAGFSHTSAAWVELYEGNSNVTSTPPVGSLAFTGIAGALVFTLIAAPPVGSLAFTGLAPTLIEGINRVASPPVGSLTFTGLTPNTNAGTTVFPLAGSFAFTGLNVIVQFAGPDTGTFTFTGLAPTLAFGGNPLKTPPVGSLAFTGLAPTAISPSGGSRQRWRARR